MCARDSRSIPRRAACAVLASGIFLATARSARASGVGPALPTMTAIGNDVSIGRIAARVWVHTTVGTIAGVRVPANGLLVEREYDAILVDTGYEPRQTAALMAWSAARGKPIAQALVTHFHADRLGGIAALDAASIPVSGNALSVGLAMEHGYDPPAPLVGVDAAPQRFGDGEAFFPGAGHTRDNLTFALGERGIVFGGCLIRSIAAPTLGNVEDAVLADWDASVRAVQARYRNATIVVPGHGKIGGDPIGHTLNLLAASGHGP